MLAYRLLHAQARSINFTLAVTESGQSCCCRCE